MQTFELINFGSKVLKEKLIPSYKLDSELLLANVLGKKREQMLISMNETVSRKNIDSFNSLIKRRSRSEPIAYILNKKEFWSKSFFVDKRILIPRPETELMVDLIVKKFMKRNITILDIGTGTGCILISILSELKNSRGIGIDICEKSIRVAKKNSTNPLDINCPLNYIEDVLMQVYFYVLQQLIHLQH